MDGILWGYVPCYYSLKGWICISDPENDNIPVVDVEATANHVDFGQKQATGDEDFTDFEKIALLGVMIVYVVAITLLLIRVVWRKDKNKNKV